MATNEVYRDADHLSLPVPSGTVSGAPVLVGSLPGVAQTGRGEGGNESGNATVWLKGAYDLEVTGAVSNVGDPVYIDGSGALNVTNTNTLFGYALATKTAAAAVLPVRIAQV